MKFHRATAACICALAAGTALAAPIDTEQKAAAATNQGFQFVRGAPGNLAFISNHARGNVEAALARLAAMTTPATLARTAGGMALSCDFGGSLDASVSRGLPRVLRLRWTDCTAFDSDGLFHLRNGDAEITLASDSFAPKNLVGIRLGNATQDFRDERFSFFPGQDVHETRTSNLRMLGVIPMTRASRNNGSFIGRFAFEVTGFYDEFGQYSFPDSGSPPFESHLRIDAEHLIAAGSFDYVTPALNHSVSETNLLWGTLTTTFFSPPPFGTTRTVSSFEGLRLREELDFGAFTSTLAIDGKLNYQPQQLPALNDGCVGGDLVYRTRVPVSGGVFTDFTAGELTINNSATTKIYSAANLPPSLPFPNLGTLLRFDVRNAGTFDHDTAAVFQVLREVGQCTLP